MGKRCAAAAGSARAAAGRQQHVRRARAAGGRNATSRRTARAAASAQQQQQRQQSGGSRPAAGGRQAAARTMARQAARGSRRRAAAGSRNQRAGRRQQQGTARARKGGRRRRQATSRKRYAQGRAATCAAGRRQGGSRAAGEKAKRNALFTTTTPNGLPLLADYLPTLIALKNSGTLCLLPHHSNAATKLNALISKIPVHHTITHTSKFPNVIPAHTSLQRHVQRAHTFLISFHFISFLSHSDSTSGRLKYAHQATNSFHHAPPVAGRHAYYFTLASSFVFCHWYVLLV